MPTAGDTDSPNKQKTSRSSVLLQKLTVSQPLKNLPQCMKPERSQPCSRQPDIRPYPEPY